MSTEEINDTNFEMPEISRIFAGTTDWPIALQSHDGQKKYKRHPFIFLNVWRFPVSQLLYETCEPSA